MRAPYCLGLLVVTVALFAPATARPVGVLSASASAPIELRLAVALPSVASRSSLWVQLRLGPEGGAVALIAPAPPGASLDWSSAAWLEALEAATARRVLAPEGPSPCPGVASGVHVAGDLEHGEELDALVVTVLDDKAAVEQWVASQGLAMTADAASGLSRFGSKRFVAARFDAPAGRETLTRTLRIVSPEYISTLPLVLTSARERDLLVTTWAVGERRAELDGAVRDDIDEARLVFGPDGRSNYVDLRNQKLLSSGAVFIAESASRRSFVEELAVGGGATVPSVARVFFDRAAAYGDATGAPAGCFAQTEAAFQAMGAVGQACPKAALGVVGAAESGCKESPAAGETDPSALRCGSGADDLALALSGLVPAQAWLTRLSTMIARGESGITSDLITPTASEKLPVLQAAAFGCGGRQVPVYEVETGCGAAELGAVLYYVAAEATETDPPDALYVETESCGGDTSEPREDDEYDAAFGVQDGGEPETTEAGGCGGDASEESDDGGCGGDTSDTSEGGDGGDDGSGGDASSSSTATGSGGGEEGSSSSSGCGSDKSKDGSGCALAERRRSRGRLSPWLLGAAAVAFSLRRAGRAAWRKGPTRHP